MQARYYDPVIGRFLAEDPMNMLSMEMNPGYFNRYMYTMNDPINFIDPTGMVVELTGNAADREAFLTAASDVSGLELTEKDGQLQAEGDITTESGASIMSAINSNATISVNAVSNDDGISFDSFATGDIDAGDISSINSQDSDLANGLLTHVFAERTYAAENPIPGGSIEESFGPAHDFALRQEARVFGAASAKGWGFTETSTGNKISARYYFDSKGNQIARRTIVFQNNGGAKVYNPGNK